MLYEKEKEYANLKIFFMTNKDDNVVSEIKHGLYACKLETNQLDLFNKFLMRANDGPNPEAQTAIKLQFELNDG